jgi:hypothetical protein
MHKTPANGPLTHVHTTRCVLELDVQTALKVLKRRLRVTDIESRGRMSVLAGWIGQCITISGYWDGLTRLKHPLPGRERACRSSEVSLTCTFKTTRDGCSIVTEITSRGQMRVPGR